MLKNFIINLISLLTFFFIILLWNLYISENSFQKEFHPSARVSFTFYNSMILPRRTVNNEIYWIITKCLIKNSWNLTSTIFLHWVPFPAPGAPKTKTTLGMVAILRRRWNILNRIHHLQKIIILKKEITKKSRKYNLSDDNQCYLFMRITHHLFL